MVVLDDADLDAAAEASLSAAFLCAGQSCTAGERFLVHEAVHDEYLEPGSARRSRARSGSATRSTTRSRWARSTTSRRPRRWIGTSRRRSSGARRLVRRRCARRGLSDPAVLRGNGARRSDARDGGRQGGDVRADRPRLHHRERRGGPTDRQLVASTGCSPPSGRAISRAVSASPRRRGPAGSTSTSRRTTGRATCPSAAAPAPARGSAASVGAIRSKPSPSRRRWSSRSRSGTVRLDGSKAAAEQPRLGFRLGLRAALRVEGRAQTVEPRAGRAGRDRALQRLRARHALLEAVE